MAVPNPITTIPDNYSVRIRRFRERLGLTQVPVPKASADVVNTAIGEAVLAGKVWLLSGPASLLAEPIPAGVLAPTSTLCVPPAVINVAEILPANLPNAWPGDETNALAIATALSQKPGKPVPWKTVKDVIGASLNARFTQLADGSAPWPCDLPAAQTVQQKVAPAGPGGGTGGGDAGGGATGSGTPPPTIRVAEADFKPSQIQDLGDLIPALLELKAKCMVFADRILDPVCPTHAPQQHRPDSSADNTGDPGQVHGKDRTDGDTIQRLSKPTTNCLQIRRWSELGIGVAKIAPASLSRPVQPSVNKLHSRRGFLWIFPKVSGRVSWIVS